MRSHRQQACFSRTVRITRKALRISSSCSAASSPGNSANHRTPGNLWLPSAAAASHPGSDSGNGLRVRVWRSGRCTARSSARPVSVSLSFLQPAQVSFHLCDTAGYLSERLPKFIPAKLIQLRLQMVYFSRSRLLSFSGRAWISASCSAGRCFSRKMSSEEVSFISPYFTGLILQQPG